MSFVFLKQTSPLNIIVATIVARIYNKIQINYQNNPSHKE